MIHAAAECDVTANGPGARSDFRGRLRGARIGVNADPTEVVTEARLHEGTGGAIQRLTGRAQHIVHDRRRATVSRSIGRSAFQLLLPGLRARAIELCLTSAG